MEKNYANGVLIKAIETQYGEILKVGVNLEKFNENPNVKGWINLDIKKSKSGNYYAELQQERG